MTPVDTHELTPVQARMLDEVRQAGQRIYNGRARRTVKALEDAGLVAVDWDLILHGNGRATERVTVTPAAIEPDPTTQEA